MHQLASVKVLGLTPPFLPFFIQVLTSFVVIFDRQLKIKKETKINP